jgi:hypothetical protein
VSAQYLLDLEREAFVSLCGEKKTQERIQHAEDRQAAPKLTRSVAIDRRIAMNRGTITKASIFFLTIAGWFSIVLLYGYKYIWTRVAHPPALDRFPVDPESVALDRIPALQPLSFTISRLPFLFALLIVILMIEIKLFSRQRERGDMNLGML